MAMRRLSVIDLGTGHQPIGNETGEVWIVFNGEIYNYRDLREGLLARGHAFHTHSDTEVLVHLYEEEGDAFLPRLMGMFAFAIHDRRKRRLVFARDRFGEKPFYYYRDRGLFVFSSELASLLEHPRVPRVLDIEALRYYLRTGIVPAPLTMFQGVRTLPPGHVLSVSEAGDMEERPYFRLRLTPDPSLADPAKAAARVLEALSNAVRRQLVADVPLGAFLSGGIDSSTVVALASRLKPDPVRTFTVRFPGAGYDEGEVAGAISRHLRTRHVEHRVEHSGFRDQDLWRIVDHVGQPFLDSSAIPTGMVSELARQHVTVCLSGDGGDEIFAGYNLFFWARPIQSASGWPRALLRAAEAATRMASAAPWLPGARRFRQAGRALDIAALPERMQILALHELFGAQEVSALARGASHQSLLLPVDNLMTEEDPGQRQWSLLRRMLAWRIRFHLEADMLVKVDRMSMAHSLEVRAPFLDPEVVDVAWSIPDRLLIRHGWGKWVVREAIGALLPEEVFSHPKQGFSIPLHLYRNEAYVQVVRSLLLEEHALHALIDRDVLRSILAVSLEQNPHRPGSDTDRAVQQVWALAQLFGWMTRFRVRLP